VTSDQSNRIVVRQTEITDRAKEPPIAHILLCHQRHRAQSAVNLDLLINQRVREFWPVVYGNHCQMSELDTVADSLKPNARHLERRSNAANSVENAAIPGIFTREEKGDILLY
jgi:hypothetical protein